MARQTWPSSLRVSATREHDHSMSFILGSAESGQYFVTGTEFVHSNCLPYKGIFSIRFKFHLLKWLNELTAGLSCGQLNGRALWSHVSGSDYRRIRRIAEHVNWLDTLFRDARCTSLSPESR